MAGRNLTKPFSIAGFILGEIYLLYSALPPYFNGVPVELSVQIQRVVIGSIFFGPFGACAGLGVGLIVGALWRKR